jgi:iron complex outermembrane receptor protein
MKKLLLASSALAAFGATGATAQETDTSPSRVDEIVVTAQKREQRLQDVPLSVSAISGESLAERQIFDVADIALVDPSVTYTQSTNPLNSSLRIRGIGTDVFSSAVEPSVSIVVDGVVLARQGQAFADLIDIERVEVLRGPQSTLFGKNASAGVISITTQAPSDTFEATAEVLIAELDEYQARGTISGPISDKVGGRLTGWYRDVGGHIDNVFDGRDLNGQESWGLRGKLLIEATPNLDIQLLADYRDAEAQCCAWQFREVNTPALAAALAPVEPSDDNLQTNIGSDLLNKSEEWGTSAEINWDIGEHTLTSITSYREWDFENTGDLDGTPSAGGLPVFLGGILGFNTNDGFTNLRQTSQEVRLTSPDGGDLSYVLGGFAWNLDIDRRFERRICLANFTNEACPALLSDLNPALPPIPGAQSGFFDGTVDNTNLGLFGQADWRATDALTFTAGARLIYDETEFTFARPNQPLFPGDSVNGNIPEEERFGEGSVDDTAMTWRFSAQYEISSDIMIYGGYTRGYKGPTVDVAYEPDDLKVDPETSDSFELGLKSTLADGRVTLNVALFDVTYEDFQAQTFDPNATEFRLTNAGEVSTRGVEADLAAQLTDAFRIDLSAAYIDAEIEEFAAAECYIGQTAAEGCVDGFQDLAGGQLTNAPEWRLSANARYDLVLPSAPFDLFATGGYVWQDDVQFSLLQNPGTVQEAYGMLNASVGASSKDDRYVLQVFVRNVLDQDFAQFILQDPVNTGAVNIAHYQPKLAQRYVGGSLRVNF